jgi:hypothetical protein
MEGWSGIVQPKKFSAISETEQRLFDFLFSFTDFVFWRPILPLMSSFVFGRLTLGRWAIT